MTAVAELPLGLIPPPPPKGPRRNVRADGLEPGDKIIMVDLPKPEGFKWPENVRVTRLVRRTHLTQVHAEGHGERGVWELPSHAIVQVQ